MSEPPPPAGEAGTEALQAEIRRLNKIVAALMDRAEASMDAPGSDFAVFQTTVLLQDQVRLHTQALEAALQSVTAAPGPGDQSMAQDMQTLRRTAALQIQLLELVVQEKDVTELVERVSTIIDMPIVLFDTRGRAVCSSRSAATIPGMARRLWSAHTGRPAGAGSPGAVEDAGDFLHFREIAVMGRTERVLAAVATHRRTTEFAGASLTFLQQLITLDLLHRRDELRMRRRLRRGLLRDILAGAHDADKLRIRMEEQGFDTAAALRIFAVEPASIPDAAAEGSSARSAGRFAGSVMPALDAALRRRRIPFLSVAVVPAAVVLTSLPDAETATARALTATLRGAAAEATGHEQVVAGSSTPLGGPADAPRCLQQARAACMAARRSPAKGGVAVFDDLGGHLVLLDGLDQHALAAIVEGTFAPLLAYDREHRSGLFATLATLFDHRLAMQETADALHVHRNTLQKRLANIEQLMGVDLDELDDIVDIRLGLKAAALLRHRPS